MAFNMVSGFDIDDLLEMNGDVEMSSLSKDDMSLFPDLPGSVDVSTTDLGLPFESDVLDVTDSEDLMSYLGSNRDKTSSIGSMSPRDASDVFDETEQVSPPIVSNKPPVMKVVRIVKLPGKGMVKLVDNVDARRLEASKGESHQSMSKNAVAARENRQKKKAYINGLEQSVDKLRTENKGLKSDNDKMSKSIESLRAEVQYLKSVLANQSTLSGLLRNIGATPGVQFKSSLFDDADDEADKDSNKKQAKRFSRKRKMATEDREIARKENVAHNLRLVESMSQPKKRVDHDYIPENDSSSDSEVDVGGVCLHVNKKNVSLEFCSTCSSSSGRASQKKR